MQHFYAYISRLKLIKRWGLMRNTQSENDSEHSLQVAFIAHGLAVISKYKYHKDVNLEKVVVLACYHDVSEVITGDLPTPIKYYNSNIKNSYKDLERTASMQLLNMLKPEYRDEYSSYLLPDKNTLEYKLVKAADKICAYIKCVEEVEAGNKEFEKAKSSIFSAIKALNMEEIDDFMQESIPSFSMSLDEISKDIENPI